MNKVTRSEVEDLLFDEAALLDNWKLKEWLQLFTADAAYEVPSTELPRDADPGKSLFYIADDFSRLEQRVIRLNKRTMWSEYPRSRTRHLVSNVRITEQGADSIRADAAFAVYRTKWGNTDVFIGSYDYTLRRTEQGLRILRKRCHLDLDGLRPQGRISILL
jgi:p-cumate 2,3-dioxygenase beta subunit